MQLTKNFSLEELTATSKKVNNTPNSVQLFHLKETANMLQSLRDVYGKGIKINSGFRSAALNKMVGGSATSAHSYGYAADTVPSNGDMKTYQKVVLEWAKMHAFDQIIIEYPTNYVASWIHIGLKNGSGLQRKQILYTVNGKNYQAINNKFYLK